VLTLLAALAYSNSYRGAFVYDDALCLTEPTQLISKWWPPSDATGRKFTTGGRRWLTHLTFVANYKLHGYHVAGYHVTNNLIHLGAALCLFGLVRRTLLLPATRERYEASASWLALAIAAIWLVHPLQTESVTYIVQRLESLAGCLLLLSLYLFLRGTQSTKHGWLWFGGLTLVVWLGTGSKETMYLAPLAVLFYDRVYLSASWRQLWQQRWPVYAAILPALVWSTWCLRRTVDPTESTHMGFNFKGVTAWEYLRTQPEVILHYLKLMFWPAEMCIDYGWRVQDDPRMIFGLGAIIVALVIATLALLWYRPRVGFVAFMFFLVLAPTSSIIPIRDLAFEHRMYLALASAAIGVVLGGHALLSRFCNHRREVQLAFGVVLTFVVVGLSARTWQRNFIYHDPVALWREVVTRSPWHARGPYNLAHLLTQRGRIPGGLPHYRHLLLHNAFELEALGNREAFVPVNDDLAEAIVWFEKTLEVDPQDPSAAFNIAGIYDLARQPNDAITWYRRAIETNPKHVNARMNLAKLLAERGDVAESEQQFAAAIAQAPRDGRVYLNYGKMLASQDRHQEAIAQFTLATKHRAPSTSVQYRLAMSQWELGQEREAITGLRELRRTTRNTKLAAATLAKFLALTTEPDLYQPAEGAAILTEVIQQAPSAEVFEALAVCQLELKQMEAAAVSIERGLALAQEQHDEQRVASLRILRERLPSPVSLPKGDE
jgi:Tfp pilus assembly protein PilF